MEDPWENLRFSIFFMCFHGNIICNWWKKTLKASGEANLWRFCEYQCLKSTEQRWVHLSSWLNISEQAFLERHVTTQMTCQTWWNAPCWPVKSIRWEFQDPKMELLYQKKGYILGVYPLNHSHWSMWNPFFQQFEMVIHIYIYIYI